MPPKGRPVKSISESMLVFKQDHYLSELLDNFSFTNLISFWRSQCSDKNVISCILINSSTYASDPLYPLQLKQQTLNRVSIVVSDIIRYNQK